MADDLRVTARVTANGHTARKLQWNALVMASELYEARLDDGTWYVEEDSDLYKLTLLDTAEATQASHRDAGWVATFLVGLEKV